MLEAKTMTVEGVYKLWHPVNLESLVKACQIVSFITLTTIKGKELSILEKEVKVHRIQSVKVN